MNEKNVGKRHCEVCMKETSGFVLMLEPKEGKSHAAAKALAACGDVDKVDMTSGSCAIMVHGSSTLALSKVLAAARAYGDATNFAIKHLEYAKKR